MNKKSEERKERMTGKVEIVILLNIKLEINKKNKRIMDL